MSTAFKQGLFDDGIPERKSVRLWLATLLNCDPMRLSKRFHRKSNLMGMAFFKKNHEALAAMSPQERVDRRTAMETMRMRFIESIGGMANPVRGPAWAAPTRPNLALRRPRAREVPVKSRVSSPTSVSCDDVLAMCDQVVLDLAIHLGERDSNKLGPFDWEALLSLLSNDRDDLPVTDGIGTEWEL
ncbi:hypothetical protein DYB32_005573 [Aphanomyces invadans]|uniref:Uncharacterized protein n=1 Tax=Aphanomyces invadans TaxID=157072 RepID=A0A3R6ZPD5_9STRA|nr:hypothetical protein DYB32_005573 [Aphanomyces invadans]